jgi:CRP/FNR family transcriptional regulator, cyclic AMP receptor protein
LGTSKELIDFLKGILLFRNFSPEEMKSITRVAQPRTIPSNTMVFSEESVGNALYIIRDGHVKVSKEIEGYGNLPLLVLGPGEFFGEMSLVRPGPRLVSVRTLETTDFVVFSKEDWDNYVGDNPVIARKFIELISNWFLLKLRRSNPEFNRFIQWRLNAAQFEPES